MNPINFDNVWNFLGTLVLVVLVIDILGDKVVDIVKAWRRK